ncbi:PEP-CTERM sorting domain-containing protein [Derxia lacustris]|uniref:PEP-CTERM sorting domain-containing protein n=1 Tax=Derxia lacustris TaxID=764842 RepID=UPI000A16E3DF|nr:PEP-CTERM sorting domain-containing protein [Derxia lacustris]
MKMKRILLAAGLAAAFASGSARAAQLVNGGFEDGTLTGWSSYGNVSVSSGSGAGGGSFAALLTAGLGTGVYTMLSQTVTLAAGETVNGIARWIGNDYLPYNDNGFVRVLALSNLQSYSLFNADIATWGNYGSSPWVSFSFAAPTAGIYTLYAGVANSVDNVLDSGLKVDFGTTLAPVPEPEIASLAFLGLGAVGLAARRRRGRRD